LTNTAPVWGTTCNSMTPTFNPLISVLVIWTWRIASVSADHANFSSPLKIVWSLPPHKILQLDPLLGHVSLWTLPFWVWMELNLCPPRTHINSFIASLCYLCISYPDHMPTNYAHNFLGLSPVFFLPKHTHTPLTFLPQAPICHLAIWPFQGPLLVALFLHFIGSLRLSERANRYPWIGLQGHFYF
jgi:hypothetical protein